MGVLGVFCNNAVLCCNFILLEADEQISMMEHWRKYLWGKSDVLGENLVQVALCPLQIRY